MTITDAEHPGQHFDPVSGNWVDDAPEAEPVPTAGGETAPEGAVDSAPSTDEPTAPETPEPSATDEHAGESFDQVTGNWVPDETEAAAEPSPEPVPEPEAAPAPEAAPEAVAPAEEPPAPTWLDVAKQHLAAAVDAINSHLGA